MNKAQINLRVPKSWKESLEKIARKLSFNQDREITYLDLAIQALDEKYSLSISGSSPEAKNE